MGLLAIRREGIYFSMITLALAQMMYFVALRAKFTGGEDGIQAVPRGKMFGLLDLSNDMTMYFVVVAIFVGAFLLIYRIVHSPFGEVLKAIRENEPRAISLGYDVDRYKLLAFVLSTALAGLGGSLKTLVLGFATLSDAHWSLSGEVVLMTLLGGMAPWRTIWRCRRRCADISPKLPCSSAMRALRTWRWRMFDRAPRRWHTSARSRRWPRWRSAIG